MKKILSFILLGLMCSIGNLWADTEIFSYTVVNPAKGSYTATGGTAECTTAMASGGSNEITIGNQTFYKFNSSSAWTFTLSSGTFLVGDVVSFTCACTTSAKSGKGIAIQTSPVISVTGDFPASTANTISYTVKANDGIAGQSTFSIKRNDSDIKFGTVTVTRAATYTVTYNANGGTGSMDPTNNEIVANSFIAPAGQAFIGWNTAADGNGDAYKAGDAVTSNLNLYAQWATVYTVTYKANGGTGDDVVDNQAVAIAANTFTAPAGKMFLRWNTAADGTGTDYAVDAAVTSNLTLYAQWASIYGEIIKATLNGGNSAAMTGVIGGTFDSNLGSGKYKIDKNVYAGIQLASGTFHEGDTAIITMTTAGGNNPCLFADKDRNNCLFLATESSSALVYKIVLPAAANSLTTLYLSRGNDNGDDAAYKWNPTVSTISVVRPMPEKSRSAAEITSVEIDNVALDAASLSTLKTNHSFASVEEYVEAPVVKFFTSVTVTYDDDSQKVIDEEIVANVTEDPVGTWKAVATINAINYIITFGKTTSYTVTYKDGDATLGTEAVALNGNPAEFANYQYKQLCSFLGWYNNPDLQESHKVIIASEVITADATYYGKWEEVYAASINIEQLVLDNGTTYDLMSQMGALGYASNITNDLDSLNDTKASRNEPYLGQKIKAAGKLLNFRVAAGNTVKVKFGNIGTTPQVSINGGDYANMTINNKVYTYTADVETVISIKTVDSKTVVLKQIQIGADPQIAEVVLPASDEFVLGANGYSTYANKFKYTVSGATAYTAVYNGSDAVTLSALAADAVIPANAGIILKGTEGETVTIMASDDDAVAIANNDLVGVVTPIAATAGMYVLSTNAGVTAFNPCQVGLEIPAHKAYISISSNAPSIIRIIENATNIENVEANEEAVKFMQDGKLYIMKNGVLYNAVGAVVK